MAGSSVSRTIRRCIPIIMAAALLVALLGVRIGSSRVVQAAGQPPVSVQSAYGKLPLSFIANAGQTDSSVHFQVRGSEGMLSFQTDGVLLNLPALTPNHINPDRRVGTAFLPSESVLSDAQKRVPTSETGSGTEGTVVLRLTFDHANPNVVFNGANQLPGIANFFIGSDPSQWHTDVPTYAGVIYHDLYPGIDLQYGGHAGLLKGTYLIAAGVDPALIRWNYGGANGMTLDPTSGDLTIAASEGVTLTEQAPIAWQTQSDGRQTPVKVGYQLNADGNVQFAVGAYDRSLPLVIDPGLVYSSYLGGSGFDAGIGIAVDTNGNAYVTGYTSSVNFPTTVSAYHKTYGGGSYDAFVTKLNPLGSALIYSTYLGGGGTDAGTGIAVDLSGDAYVTGYTSGGFPTTSGASQTVYGGGPYDAFVTKLNATGNALIYSTYEGGSGDDEAHGIAVDGFGYAFITGSTSSTDLPRTLSAAQIFYGGGSTNAFAVVLNPSGSALTYGTYLGGNVEDVGFGIATDGLGNAYVTGYTRSTNFPTTSGAFQTVYGGAYDNAFVSDVNINQSGAASLIYSTFLGGSGDVYGGDVGFGIAVSGYGYAYVTGYTYSSNFPTTPGAYQTILDGAFGANPTSNAFVTVLNEFGTGLVYSTYLGGNGGGSLGDSGHGITLFGSGSNVDAYVAGEATSTNFPTTSNAYQTTYGNGGSDAFVSILNPSGTGLVYSTYLGGNRYDSGNGIGVDGGGNAYVAGNTYGGFPTTTGAFQTAYGGGSSNGFVAMLEPGVPILNINPPALPNGILAVAYTHTLSASTTDPLAGPLTLALTNGTLPPGLTFNAGTGVITGAPTTEGTYGFTIRASDRGGFTTSQTYSITVAPVIGLNPAMLPNPVLAQTYSRTLTAYGGQSPYSYAILSGALPTGLGLGRLTGVLSGTPTVAGTFAFTITAIDNQGFTGSQSYTMTLGQNTIGVYRPSALTFFLRSANSTGYANFTIPFGVANSLPLVGDWNGDGIDTVGTFNSTTGLFTLTDGTLPNPPATYTFALGNPNDTPFAGRWDNTITHDGVGVFRPSNGLLYLKDALTTGFADHTMVLGIPGDQGIAGDWDGNGFDSPGVYRPSNNTFYLTNQVCNCSVFADYQATFGSGGNGALGFAGDWTGSGHTGVGLFQNGSVSLKAYPYTGNQADSTFAFGVAGDEPLAGYWGAVSSVAHRLTPDVLVPPTLAPAPTGRAPSDGLGD